jgi:diguanylate cyclase (GGDEF)-like protein/PAS domain S-box-containing protein
LDPAQLALGIALVAIVILAWSLIAALLDASRARGLEAETRRLRRLLDATFEGILFHRDGIVTEVSAQLCALLGTGREALIGREVRAVLGDAALPVAVPGHAATSLETDIVDAAGRRHPVELLARPPTDAEGGEQVLAVRDLSERRRAEQRIAHLAHHDPLTGLANRGLFGDMVREALEHADRAGGRLALLFIDLDGFKSANDLLGHASGDQLLTAVAVRLRGTSRQMDAVARIGGDEFAILQPLAGLPERAATLADRVVRLLSQPFEIAGQTIRIGASVGVALSPGDARTPDDLLRKANVALHRAKQDGKGTYRFFEAGMDAHMRERRELELDLRAALTSEQFSLNYQGQYDAATLAPVGYEALLRWDHPKLGRVSPATFIPIAEASGTIREIGAWVLATACREAAAWSRPLRLSVNLSPAQFKGTDLPRAVRETLARTGLPPARLELEITEGVLIDDPDSAFAVLSDIKAQGVRLALDDFGTGYASLGYLRRFPFDTLKIDKSFVQAIGQDASSDAIVRAVVGLGRSLELEVIAEGVETPQQLAFLRAQKCHEVQGFLLGRPLPAADLDRAMVEAARA